MGHFYISVEHLNQSTNDLFYRIATHGPDNFNRLCKYILLTLLQAIQHNEFLIFHIIHFPVYVSVKYCIVVCCLYPITVHQSIRLQ